ncbi:hypothetical protein ACZ87_03650 [Candidatus Erwinia dacicola]|uniref:Uncharacterized protein n=1 Tax=Candidatus Erwinia dacicola TaxID=252393 RepID=A0A328THM6_9GAMM|nr:hypothetical protein ACZ87_03650 [Candidatus Erwinia dacicola]
MDACSWNSVSLLAKIHSIAISSWSDKLAESCISNFLTGESATAWAKIRNYSYSLS